MQQYFVKGTYDEQTIIPLDEEQSHHIRHVLRMKEHDEIRIVDEQRTVFLCEVLIKGTQVYAGVKETLPAMTSRVRITLALALIKGERWDFAIQKACELGVTQIQPLITSRCVVKFKEDASDKKLKRWNKIALEACEQCKRSDLVEVMRPVSLSELTGQAADLKLMAYEHADHQTDCLKQIIQHHPDVTSILCVIGPEGGFAEAEADALLREGFLCTSLGPRILRAETAALSIVNTLSVYYES